MSKKKKKQKLKSFDNPINNIKEMITYFKDENNKSQKKYKKYKTLSTILKSFETFVIIATTSSSLSLFLTGLRLIVIHFSTGVAYGLAVSSKMIFQIVRQKFFKYKKLFEKDQQTNKSFNFSCRKSLQVNLNDKNEYESLCKIFN